MTEIQIADKVFIAPSHFGNYNQRVVHPLLGAVASSIDIITEAKDKRVCQILKSPRNNPFCVQASQDINVIYLNTKGDYWCQWVYQFAHEYLHHIIGGTLSGERRGLFWLEETLAELSSIYQLGMFHQSCLISPNPILLHFAPSVRGYLHALLVSHQDLKLEIQESVCIRRWLPFLSEPRYHRDRYNAIACRVLPLFLDNPRLWRIAAHMGDSRQYDSLDSLWERLRKVADGYWRDSLEKLIALLS